MTTDELLQRQFELQYRADYSQRYHRRRANFLQRIDIALSSLIIFSSGAAFTDLVSDAPSWVLQVSAAVVALVATLQVLLSFGANGPKHAEWMKRWNRLSAEIENTSNPSDRKIQKWASEKADIEGDCVSELRALSLDCEDKSASFLGIPGRQHRIWSLQRLLIHFGTFQQTFPIIVEPENGLVGKEPELSHKLVPQDNESS